MEPLHRTWSSESQRSSESSQSHTQHQSPLLDHKAHYAEADAARVSSVAVKRASISMPHPSKPNPHLSPRRPSKADSEHNLFASLLHTRAMASSNLADSSSAIDDTDVTPTATQHSEPNLQVPRSDTDSDSNRLSFSLYQLGSALYDRARGAVSSTPASSVAGSETDGTSTIFCNLSSFRHSIHLCFLLPSQFTI